MKLSCREKVEENAGNEEEGINKSKLKEKGNRN